MLLLVLVIDMACVSAIHSKTGAVKGALRGSGPSFNTPSISTPSLSKTNKQVKKGAEKLSKQVGVTNKVKAGRPTYPISGAKLNKPLVQDSTGRSFN